MKMLSMRICAVFALVSVMWAAPLLAQEAAAPDPLTVVRGALPRDLSPWGMFLSANKVVQAVIIGLALASVITWTIGLAKAVELVALKRKLRRALTTLDAARSPAEAEKALDTGGPAAELVRAAVAEAGLPANGSATA